MTEPNDSGRSSESTRLWASVAVVVAAIAAIATLLLNDVSVERIMASFSIITGLASLYLIGEVRAVKQNTNGTLEAMRTQLTEKDLQHQSLLREYAEYAKRSVPVAEIGTVTVKTED